MTVVPFLSLLADAHRRGVGLPAFNVLHLETAEALAEAAERTGVGVVLQISENCVRFHGGLSPVLEATRRIAEASTAPLSIHLDHAQDPDLVREAIALGIGSVMVDAAHLDDEANIALTRQLTDEAHAAGVSVEAELGEVGGKGGAHTPGVRTDPSDAREFVARTGVDALAVAVGSSHHMVDRTASLNDALITELARAVPVPLVLHGSSGVPDHALQSAIRAGITKVNVSTQLNKVFTRAVRVALDDAALVDSRVYLGAGRAAMADEAARLIRIIALNEASPQAPEGAET